MNVTSIINNTRWSCCMCIGACIHTYMHACIHACTIAHVNECMHTCMHANRHTWLCTYMHTCKCKSHHTCVYTWLDGWSKQRCDMWPNGCCGVVDGWCATHIHDEWRSWSLHGDDTVWCWCGWYVTHMHSGTRYRCTCIANIKITMQLYSNVPAGIRWCDRCELYLDMRPAYTFGRR